MWLLLDAGNTRLKWALAGPDHVIVNTGIIAYDALSAGLKGLAANIMIDAIAVSSVAGVERDQQLCHLCQEYFQLSPLFARVSAAACGLDNDYQALDRLGVDRWVAALGLAELSGINRIIVDAGTAITVDVVSANDVYLGGVILPGAKLMHDSLVGETAGIFSQHSVVSNVIGKTTDQCVNAGTSYGLAGAIERVIQEMQTIETNREFWRVYLCGGDAQWLSRLLSIDLPVFEMPNLLFDGLLNMIKSEAIK